MYRSVKNKFLSGVSCVCASSLLLLVAGGHAVEQQHDVTSEASALMSWAAMDVMKLKASLYTRGRHGLSGQVVTADVTGDDRDEIIMVNRRQSRLEIYRWRDADEQQLPNVREHANDMVFPAHIDHTEVQLDDAPLQVQVLNSRTLAVLSGPSYKIRVFLRQDDGTWQMSYEIKLLDAEPTRHLQMLRCATVTGDTQELLISCKSGIQRVVLAKDAKPTWMRPRHKHVPWKWWLTDLDGDGDKDLVKLYGGKKRQSLLWSEMKDEFVPEQTVYKTPMRDMLIIDAASTDAAVSTATASTDDMRSHVMVIDKNGSGLLRHLRLQTGDDKKFGHASFISLPSKQAPWVGVRKGSQRSLVAVNNEHPQLMTYDLKDGAWTQAALYPCVSDVIALVAPVSENGVLLLQRKGAATLLRCDWKNGRFTYPQPWHGDDDHTEGELISLGDVDGTCWWVEKEDNDLVVYTWGDQDDKPRSQRYEDCVEPKGKKGRSKKKSSIEKVQWLGGNSLLVQDAYARHPRLLQWDDGDVEEHTEAHIKSMKFAEIQVLRDDQGILQPVRLANGVVQYLDASLQARDQVMLEDGQEIVACIVLNNMMYALERGGKILHQLKKDVGGVLRSVEQYDLTGGQKVVYDKQLGVMLENNGYLTRLTDGARQQLEVEESVDDRDIRAEGMKHSSMHRLFAADLFPSTHAAQQVMVFDDYRHRASVFNHGADGLTGVASWQIFEDDTYPYGEEDGEDRDSEPRYVTSLNFDDDDKRDLLMICHDRLLIYRSAPLNEQVAKDNEKGAQK